MITTSALRFIALLLLPLFFAGVRVFVVRAAAADR